MYDRQHLYKIVSLCRTKNLPHCKRFVLNFLLPKKVFPRHELVSHPLELALALGKLPFRVSRSGAHSEPQGPFRVSRSGAHSEPQGHSEFPDQGPIQNLRSHSEFPDRGPIRNLRGHSEFPGRGPIQSFFQIRGYSEFPDQGPIQNLRGPFRVSR
jgi:hypothetical protein